MLIHICLGSVKNIVDYPLLRVLSDSLLLGSFLSLSSSILLALSFLFFFSPLLVTSTQRIEQNSGKIFSSIYDLAIRKKAYPGNLKIYHRQSLLPWSLHFDISLTLFPSLSYLVHLWSLSLSNILGRSTLSGPPSLSPGGSVAGWEEKRNWHWLFWITFCSSQILSNHFNYFRMISLPVFRILIRKSIEDKMFDKLIFHKLCGF